MFTMGICTPDAMKGRAVRVADVAVTSSDLESPFIPDLLWLFTLPMTSFFAHRQIPLYSHGVFLRSTLHCFINNPFYPTMVTAYILTL